MASLIKTLNSLQKPLAIVIIGGLIAATMLTLLIFPIINWIFYRRTYTHHEAL